MSFDVTYVFTKNMNFWTYQIEFLKFEGWRHTGKNYTFYTNIQTNGPKLV